MRASARPASLLFALAAGLAQAASIASPLDGEPRWWLQLGSLAVLAALLQRVAQWKTAALLGWTFATAWLAGTFWWLYISMHVYGGLPSLMAGAAVLLLAMLLATYYAAACGAFVLCSGSTIVGRVLVFASTWLAAELARECWFTGFPWGAGGYAHLDGPLAGLAPWAGVYGIGFVAAALAAMLAQALDRHAPGARRRWVVPGVALLVIAVLPWAAQRPAPVTATRTLGVALLQGNIPQDQKFEPGTGVPVALDWYRQQLLAVTAPLVVTPETAIPLLPYQLPAGYLKQLGEHFSASGQAALVGLPLGSFDAGYTNSVIGLKAQPRLYRYDKHHLVPFGEFIPPLFRWFTRMMNIPLGDFGRGALVQPSFAWQGERIAPNICYEDLFGEELAARFEDEASAPTVFVNMSNIGWFGDTVAIDQHLAISRMRAIEFERPMLRATNTGATAIIDAHGRVTHMLPRLTRGVLLGEVAGGRGITPYAWWAARAGLWPLWLLALGVPCLFRLRRRAG